MYSMIPARKSGDEYSIPSWGKSSVKIQFQR